MIFYRLGFTIAACRNQVFAVSSEAGTPPCSIVISQGTEVIQRVKVTLNSGTTSLYREIKVTDLCGPSAGVYAVKLRSQNFITRTGVSSHPAYFSTREEAYQRVADFEPESTQLLIMQGCELRPIGLLEIPW